jgi:ornithine decarboxylase
MISRAKFQISVSKTIEQYNKIKSLCDVLYYSTKSNPYLVDILAQNTDSCFLVHHINELKYFENLNNKFNFSKILFMLHSPENKELDIVFEKNINKFIVDNINDLNFLLNYCKYNNKTEIDLFLRMRLKEYTVQTGKYFVYGFYSSKINELILQLKNNKYINKLGVHFHRKTQNLAEWSLIRELEQSINKDSWDIISYLNIGGGIPVEYKNTNPSIIENIYDKIKDLKDFVNKKNIKLICEAGRSIAAPSGKLITNIVNIVDNNIFIDASVYNCSMDTIVTQIKLLVEGENKNQNGKPYVIKGATPASEDIFRYRVYFDKDLKIGDQIVFLNAGSYIYYSDLFNLEKPKIEIIK